MPDWTALVNAVVAVVPPAAVFFLAYGPYDGAFLDNVVFLYFIGGLLMGGLLGFVSLLLLSTFPAGSLFPVLFLALLLPIALVAGVNRRKWQGDRHAVFNGGAFGLGVAAMVGFTFLYRLVSALDAPNLLHALGLSLAFTGLFFGTGLLAGDGVRRRAQFRTALLGTAILFAPTVFLVEYASDRAWLWLVLLVAYGAVLAVGAERRLLIHGVSEEARKQRRRLRRKAAE